MISQAEALLARRRQPAAASGGVSDQFIYQAVIQAISDLDLRGDLLDFGAGTGTLTGLLDRLGRFRSVTAADLQPRPAGLSSAVAWVSADLNPPTPLPGEAFDLVVAAEVIEHLENPRAVAREWFRLLRPGGSVVLSTPNNESWRSLGALLLSGHFAAFRDTSYPAHITALLRKDIERVLIEAGFVGVRFRFTNVGTVPRLPRLTWQALSGSRFRGLRYSDNLVATAKRPSMEGSSGREFWS